MLTLYRAVLARKGRAHSIRALLCSTVLCCAVFARLRWLATQRAPPLLFCTWGWRALGSGTSQPTMQRPI